MLKPGDHLLNTYDPKIQYDENDIKKLNWWKHIRLLPGMYIEKLGDGSYPDDGVYVLLKELLDNAIDEYMDGIWKTNRGCY